MNSDFLKRVLLVAKILTVVTLCGVIPYQIGKFVTIFANKFDVGPNIDVYTQQPEFPFYLGMWATGIFALIFVFILCAFMYWLITGGNLLDKLPSI